MYAAAYILETCGYELEAEQKEFEDFAVSVATASMETAHIALWLESHSLKACTAGDDKSRDAIDVPALL